MERKKRQGVLEIKERQWEWVMKSAKALGAKNQGWSQGRDCRDPNEHSVLELSGSGAPSGSDNFTPKGDASKTFSGAYGNYE